jgi:hypothetical protein
MVGIWLFRPKAALNFYIFCGKAFLLGPFWLKEKHCSALISNVSLVTIICRCCEIVLQGIALQESEHMRWAAVEMAIRN